MQSKRIILSILMACIMPWSALLPPVAYAGEGVSIGAGTNLFSAAVISESRYIVVGDRGKVFLSTDSARTWKVVDSTTQQPLVSVCFPDDYHGWITGQGGVIVHSADGGNTWLAQSSGVDTYLLAVDFLDAHNGCAVGADSTVVMTTDGGTTWKRSPFKVSSDPEEDSGSGEVINLFAVVMMDSQRICCAGEKGRIFISDNAGHTWTEVQSPLYDEAMKQGRILYSLAYDSGTLYGVGIDSLFVYSKDHGRTWTEGKTGFTEPDLYCITIAGGSGLAAGSGGHVIGTKDAGSTWYLVDMPEKVTQSWLCGIDITRSPAGGVCGLIVGQYGTVGQLTDDTIRWYCHLPE